MIRHFLIAAFSVMLPAAAFAEDTKMHVSFDLGHTTLFATLDDTPAARDFAAMLPLTLTLSDYHGIEKVADLGKRLDSTGMPSSYTPQAGDITQYAPWKNLALFLKPFQNSNGLVRLGQFDGDFSALHQPGEIEVTISAAD
ncbi:MAG: cyclophilin-like fold protein [Pseudomonadota bacterium]|nr:cyclophilin-like fold protein [Pseudomonadota bacterium]